MKIGVFGGCFNPPHLMHKNIALELINKHYVDKIYFVPTGCKYKYKNNLIENKYRYDMLKILIKDNTNLGISDYEFKNYAVATWDTLEYFKNEFKNDDVYFICGADNLSYIDKWVNGLEILNSYKIIVIKRNTDNINDILAKFYKYKENIIVSEIEMSDISSTFIRNNIMDENKIINYIDRDILNYIKENNLYYGGML